MDEDYDRAIAVLRGELEHAYDVRDLCYLRGEVFGNVDLAAAGLQVALLRELIFKVTNEWPPKRRRPHER